MDAQLKKDLLGRVKSDKINFEQFIEIAKNNPQVYYAFCEQCHDYYTVSKKGSVEAKNKRGYFLQSGCVLCKKISDPIVKKFVEF